jgi:hypothetical protein
MDPKRSEIPEPIVSLPLGEAGLVRKGSLLSVQPEPDNQASPSGDSIEKPHSRKARYPLTANCRDAEPISARFARSRRGAKSADGKTKKPGNNPVGRRGKDICAQCSRRKKGEVSSNRELSHEVV